MSAANYAHCDVEPCLKPNGSTKVLYIGEEDIPFGAVVRHGECDDQQLAAAEARGYARALAVLRDDRLYQEWNRRWGLDPAGPRSYVPLPLRHVMYDYVEWAADYRQDEATKTKATFDPDDVFGPNRDGGA